MGNSNDNEESNDRALDLITYWRVNNATKRPRRFFLHLVDSNGQLIAQDDRLGAPAKYWQSGDLIVQWLSLPNPTVRSGMEIRLGVFNPSNGERLLTQDQGEYIKLHDSLFKG